jgi:hypothetical protein
MQKSDIAYIKAMLWGIVGVCQGSELPEAMSWIIILNIFLYGIEFAFYRYKENSE